MGRMNFEDYMRKRRGLPVLPYKVYGSDAYYQHERAEGRIVRREYY